MKQTKVELIMRHGRVCMHCKQNVGSLIQWHHIVPRYAGGDDSYGNGSLLCPNCHTEIHLYLYGMKEYEEMTQEILKNKFKD